jgi:hypothetical protein
VHNYLEEEELGSDFDGEGEIEEPEADEGDFQPRRSGRETKKPARLADEEDFEETMIETSPVIGEVRRTSGRLRRRVHDPDDEDEDDQPAPPKRNPFPPRSTRASLQVAPAPELGQAGPSYINGESKPNGPTRSSRRGKSRHSSADAESFEPSEDDPVSDDDASEDPMARGFHDAEDDDFESRSSSPVRRTRASARRIPTRRSARQSARHDSDDDFAGHKRNLRERPKVNYELPPLDISAEILQNAIAGASRPGGRGTGSKRASAASRLGNWLPGGLAGRDLAQAMGDPDSSDSVGHFDIPVDVADNGRMTSLLHSRLEPGVLVQDLPG